MNTKSSFSQIKAVGRAALTGHYNVAILAFLMVQIISLVPAILVDSLFPNNSIFELIGSEVLTFILNCFVMVLEAGLSLIYLKLLAKQQVFISDLYHGFRSNRNQFLLVALVFSLIDEICSIPYTYLAIKNISAGIYDPRMEYSVLLLGMLVSFIIRIPFAMSFFILIDFPNLTAFEAIKKSTRLMGRNFGRYILFMLSFVPLILLSVFSFGLGLLWVVPYIYASTAGFYLDLAKNYN